MARLNDNQEKPLERPRINETAAAVLTGVVRWTYNRLASITALLTALVNSHGDLARRVTDLER